MKFYVPLAALTAFAISLASSPSAFADNDAKHAGTHGKQGMHENDEAALGEPGKAAQVTRTIEVAMNDTMRFQPATITVKRGETVRLIAKNLGKVKHELVLGTADELKEHAELMRKFPGMEHADPNMVAVEPGKSGEIIWRFTRTGAYSFACLQPGHFEAGMVGKLAVQR